MLTYASNEAVDPIQETSNEAVGAVGAVGSDTEVYQQW
jgi:hypothetical protein